MTLSAPSPESGTAALPALPESLTFERVGDVGILRLSREAKRNALDDATVLGLEAFFSRPPEGLTCVVLDPVGAHFCAGLDLNELNGRSVVESLEHSLMWHRAFDALESGRLPVVSVLRGAVVGGGLELATSTHIRVAESTTFYALPEGKRGLFVGGGGSVRIPRLIGAARMLDLMLTGRVYSAEEGQDVGLSHYLVPEGQGSARALELAMKIAGNAPVTNFALLQALPRIQEAGTAQGMLIESLMAAIASGSDDAQERMRAFVAGRAAKVSRGSA